MGRKGLITVTKGKDSTVDYIFLSGRGGLIIHVTIKRPMLSKAPAGVSL